MCEVSGEQSACVCVCEREREHAARPESLCSISGSRQQRSREPLEQYEFALPITVTAVECCHSTRHGTQPWSADQSGPLFFHGSALLVCPQLSSVIDLSFVTHTVHHNEKVNVGII